MGGDSINEMSCLTNKALFVFVLFFHIIKIFS